MENSSEEWIQGSLARLEELEDQRKQHEKALEAVLDADTLRIHSEAIEELDAEIQKLYHQLETVANQDNGGAELKPSSDNEVAANETVVEASSDYPFASPPSDDQRSLTASSSLADMDSDKSGYYDLDYDKPKTGGPVRWLVILVLVVAVGGLASWFYLSRPATTIEEKIPEPPKVIEATPVPPDTQGPQLDPQTGTQKTQGTPVGKAPPSPNSRDVRPASSEKRGKKPQDNEKNQSSTKINIDSSDDPLAGVK